MPPERSHSDFCEKLCLICLRKGPGLRPIKGSAGYSSKHDYISYIKLSWWQDYDPNNENLPNVLCLHCRVKLARINDPTNPDPPSLPPKILYENLVFKPQTRQTIKCDCEICLHGRFRWKELGENINLSVLPPPQNPRNLKRKRPAPGSVENRCKTCLQIIGRGIRHTCNRTNKLLNLSELVRSSSKRTKSRVLSGESNLAKKMPKLNPEVGNGIGYLYK